MRIGPIVLSEEDRLATVELEFAGGRHSYYVRSDSLPLVDSPEAAIAALLPVAMILNEDIELDPPRQVCADFLLSIAAAQSLLRSWKKSFKRATIRGAIPVQKPFDPARRVASFFSGGVDAGYTLLKREPELNDLVYVQGLELAPETDGRRRVAASRARETAVAFGKRFVELETNYRQLSDPLLHVRWTGIASMSSLALLLGGHYRKIYHSSTHSFAERVPWGSDPMLDEYFGSQALEIVHFGCEASRLQKVELVATNPILLNNLRTCWNNRSEMLNCGECEKCVRTMVELRLVGGLGKTPAFPAELDLDALRKMRPVVSTLVYFEDVLRRARGVGADTPLIEALTTMLSGVERERRGKTLRTRLQFWRKRRRTPALG